MAIVRRASGGAVAEHRRIAGVDGVPAVHTAGATMSMATPVTQPSTAKA